MPHLLIGARHPMVPDLRPVNPATPSQASTSRRETGVRDSMRRNWAVVHPHARPTAEHHMPRQGLYVGIIRLPMRPVFLPAHRRWGRWAFQRVRAFAFANALI